MTPLIGDKVKIQQTSDEHLDFYEFKAYSSYPYKPQMGNCRRVSDDGAVIAPYKIRSSTPDMTLR